MTFSNFLKTKYKISYDDLLNFSLTASKKYYRFQIDKRNGEKRNIFHPSKKLKVYQKILVNEIFDKFPTHSSVFSYRKGLSIKHMVEKHTYGNYMLRIDFKNFFPSLKSSNIKNLFTEEYCKVLFPFNLTPLDITLISLLVCRNNCLTIGAVSSPQISNILLYEFDLRLNDYCTNNDITYTRYADDLFFSTKVPNILKLVQEKILSIIKEINLPLTINLSKTINSSKKHNRSMTGLTITSDNKISIGLEKKKEIKKQLYELSKPDNVINKASLGGYISYIKSVEPTFYNVLKRKYGEGLIHGLIRK